MACIKHSRCTAAFGGGGNCCPIGGPTPEDRAENRCCCSFLTKESVFIDEVDPGDLRKSLQVELATIVLTDNLVFFGGSLFFLLMLVALIFSPGVGAAVEEWAEDGLIWKRCLHFVIWPFLEWRAFLEKRDDDFVAKFCSWLLLPKGKRPGAAQLWRLLLWLVVGLFAGGAAPWVGIGALMGQIALKGLFVLALTIRMARSPFDPEDKWDMEMREKISKMPLKEEADTATALDISRDFVAAVSTGVIYFLKFVFDLLVLRAQMISYNVIPTIDAKRIVDIFPGLASVLREPAEAMYQIVVWATEAMSMVLTATIGIPQCEGTCVLYASVCLIAVLTATCRWLNYDFFGLFAGARQTAKTTRPECQRTLVIGLVVLALSLTFGSIQCFMVLFSRSAAMANPFRQSIWMCEFDDRSALYTGRVLILTATAVGCVLFFLSINGHFMGQDYLIEPLGKYLGLDLSELDPDGKGGLFTCDVFFGVVPTIGGIWADFWNVKAYIVKDRARIYAKQLRDPQGCLHCGEVHVKYSLLMVASGRQASLASQIFPYGTIVGKASEYLNDPPLIYVGKALSCAAPSSLPAHSRPKLHRSMFLTKALMMVAEVCSVIIDFVLPLAKRGLSLGIYVYILRGTFEITDDNLLDLGRYLINTAFYMALAKAACESVVESLLSFMIGVVYSSVHLAEGTTDALDDVKRTIVGQTLTGVLVGSLLAVLLESAGWMSGTLAVVLGFLLGYLASLASLWWSRRQEEPLEDVPRPRARLGPIANRIAFALLVGCVIGFISLPSVGFYGMFGIFIPVIALEVPIMTLIYVRKLSKPRGYTGVITPEVQLAASPTRKVLTSILLLPAACACLMASVMANTVFHQVGTTNMVFSALVCSIVGSFMGIIVGLSVNRILYEYPQLMAAFIFVAVCWPLAFWNVVVGIVCGAFLAAVVGSIWEEIWLRRLFQETDEKRRREQSEAIRKLEEPPKPTRNEMLVAALTLKADDQAEQAALALLDGSTEPEKQPETTLKLQDAGKGDNPPNLEALADGGTEALEDAANNAVASIQDEQLPLAQATRRPVPLALEATGRPGILALEAGERPALAALEDSDAIQPLAIEDASPMGATTSNSAMAQQGILALAVAPPGVAASDSARSSSGMSKKDQQLILASDLEDNTDFSRDVTEALVVANPAQRASAKASKMSVPSIPERPNGGRGPLPPATAPEDDGQMFDRWDRRGPGSFGPPPVGGPRAMRAPPPSKASQSVHRSKPPPKRATLRPDKK
eukprot:TRINITY_DN29159_c0_g1_i2.p1 TRINITY_DN29159_c0_g1~~TRINITY_DN29159_c0_g1_i2.p1  ORF type:complete len:1404 (-),score=260.11 TRINITY_DN29159_c0_g1_i2:78-3863(-)